MNKDGKILLAAMGTGFVILAGGLFAVNQKAEQPKVVVERVVETPTVTATPSAAFTTPTVRASFRTFVTPTKPAVVTVAPTVRK